MEDDAAIIRRIFDRFLALESVKDLKAELDREGITTRSFLSARNNRSWGNRPFSIGHLRSILQNPIYVGDIRHKDERYPGQHPAIIDRELFDRVQALISSRVRRHRMRVHAEHVNLLAGLLQDQHGNRFTSAHTSKQGVRYRYYVSSDNPATSVSEPAQPASRSRIPAGELENLVIDDLAAKLRDRQWLQANILPPGASPDEIAEVGDAARRAADRIGSTDIQTVRQQLSELIGRVTIRPDRIGIDLRTGALLGSALDKDDREITACTIEAANPFVGRSQSKRLVVRNDTKGIAPSRWLVKALARSITWYDDLTSGRAASFREIAEREGVAERYIAKLIPLAFLDPTLVKYCLDGQRALSLTASDLAFGVELPMVWAEQQG